MRPPSASLPSRARRLWAELGDSPSDWVDVMPLPTGPAALWLDRAAPTCTPPHHSVVLRMHGEIKFGRWRPFRAEQILSRHGFVWAARAGRFPMVVRGFDICRPEGGEMDWRLLGLVPVMRRAGDDVWRSAAGRHAAELLVLAPCFGRTPQVAWTSGRGDDVAVAKVILGRFKHEVSLRIDETGRLLDLSLPRWGDPDGAGFREEPFGVVFESERRFGDHLLPGSFRAGWWPGTDSWAEGEFFRCVVDDAEFS